MFYAVAHHGTDGVDSYGYAERWEGEPPRSDQTTTVVGPFASRKEANEEVERMNGELDRARTRLDHSSGAFP